MLFKNVAEYFGIELPSYLIKKNKNSFCHGLTVWTICFVDIVVSYDLFVLLCSELCGLGM